MKQSHDSSDDYELPGTADAIISAKTAIFI